MSAGWAETLVPLQATAADKSPTGEKEKTLNGWRVRLSAHLSRISMQNDPKPKPALAAESGRLDELLEQHTTIGFDHAL
jgi:hypothetical protein